MSVYYPRKQPKPKPAPSGVEARVAAEAHAFADAVRVQAKRVTWERVALVLVVLGLVGWFASSRFAIPHHPDSGDGVNPAFVTVGRDYRTVLSGAYASAWREGASALEKGQSAEESLTKVAKAWEAGRTAAFDKSLTPSLDKIVPEGQEKLSDAERRALAAAYRGLAKGLEGGR